MILAYTAGLEGMFFTFPEKEPNVPFRWVEMIAILVGGISVVIAERAWVISDKVKEIRMKRKFGK